MMREGPPRVPKVIYVGLDGQEYSVEAVEGESVMATAVKNGIPGIIGECGGNASCATCHVWVRDEYLSLVGEPNPTEEDLLEMGVSDRREGSRLSCQIKVSPDLDGLTVDIAPQEV
jgi:ferredoxin, 2Fe-2S